MDRALVIAIIGQGSTKCLHKESHQIMDSIRMCEPISKWSQTILARKRDGDRPQAFKIRKPKSRAFALLSCRKIFKAKKRQCRRRRFAGRCGS